LKMPGPKGVITIKADQHVALVCENATLTHAGRFGEKAAQDQVAKIAKTHGDSTSFKSPAPRPSTIGIPRAKKVTHVASGSGQVHADKTADEKKEATDKEVPVDLNDPKKFRVSTGLDPK
jgi:hypothetical protein